MLLNTSKSEVPGTSDLNIEIEIEVVLDYSRRFLRDILNLNLNLIIGLWPWEIRDREESRWQKL